MKHECNLGPRTSGAREETNFFVPMKRKMRKVTPKKRAAAAKMKKTPTKKLLSNKAKKHQLFRINDKTGKTGTALMRAFNTKWTNKVNISWVLLSIKGEKEKKRIKKTLKKNKKGIGKKRSAFVSQTIGGTYVYFNAIYAWRKISVLWLNYEKL